MNLIDKGEQGYQTAHGSFTPHLADLLPLNSRLASGLAIGLGVSPKKEKAPVPATRR